MGKIPGTEIAHRDGQDPYDGFEVSLFVALEVFTFKDGPKRVERRFQRLGGGSRLRGKQAAQERAAGQRFNPGGTFGRRVEGALVDVETRAFDPEFSIVGLQFGDAVEVPAGRRVVANPRTDEAANSNEWQSLVGRSSSKAGSHLRRPSSINASPRT